MPIPMIKMATIGLLPSPLKIMYYKLTGAKIGKGVSIGLLSIINSKSIEIGDDTKIGSLSFITCKKLKIGKRVKINMMVAIETGEVSVDNDSTIMEQVVIGGMITSRSKIFIGKRVKIFPYSFLNPTEEIVIEDDVGIGGANYIFTHGSWQSILDGFPVSFGPVTIKKGTWFPWRVFVMPNVTVGENATIGAGSIITKDIPSHCLAAGSPAKVLKQGDEYLKKYSREEKINIVHTILLEYEDFLRYKYEKYSNLINLSKTKDSTQVSISFIDKRMITFVEKFNENLNSDVVITFDKLKDEEINKLIKENKIWFDLESKKTFYYKDLIWLETKDFFSRYGIRFEIES